MAPAGLLNAALFTAAPRLGCPGPTRTHPDPPGLAGMERRKDTRDGVKRIWRDSDRGRNAELKIGRERWTET